MTRSVSAGSAAHAAGDVADLASLLPPLDGLREHERPANAGADHPRQRWTEWGAAALTGRPRGAPGAPRAPVADRIVAAVDLVAAVTARWGEPVVVDPARLLTARAAEVGFVRRGDVSANGSCLLLPTGAGWVAINLARPDDVECVAALVGAAADDLGPALRAALADPGLVGTLISLEIPVSVLGEAVALAPIRLHTLGRRAPVRRPLVLDLSAMWAGPLCAGILARAGARVIKVEDPDRPDGARSGPPHFFADLHRGKEHRALRLRDPLGRAALDTLLEQADVVVESSRPRALRQLGVDAEAWVAARAGRTWISITGYGRTDPEANRVAFGDDAAVAGGLVARDDQGPVFCADAVADPLTGLYAGLAGAASVAAGGGYLVEVTMAGVCAHVNRPGAAPPGDYSAAAAAGRTSSRVETGMWC